MSDTQAWMVLLGITVVIVALLAAILVRGVRTGQVRRLTPEDRDVLRRRGIDPRFGSLRRLSSDERRRLEKGQPLDTGAD